MEVEVSAVMLVAVIEYTGIKANTMLLVFFS